MHARYLLPSLGLTGLLATTGCIESDADPATSAQSDDPPRGETGKADLFGSCEGSCGGKSRSGWCYCDDLCEGYGDCCDDYVDVC